MNKIIKNIFLAIMLISVFFVFNSITVLAATTSTSTSASLPNPLGDQTDPVQITANIIKAILGILGAVTLIMFIYGGFKIIFSAGNEQKLEKGRNTLIWAIIGLAIVLSSYSILNYVFTALLSSTGAKTS